LAILVTNKLFGRAFGVFNFKENWNKLKPKDWVEGINKSATLASFILAPITIAGVISSASLKDPSTSDASDKQGFKKFLKNLTAYLYPFSFTASFFLYTLQALLSASPSRIITYLALLPFGLWNCSNEYKALNISDKIKKILEQLKYLNDPTQKAKLKSEAAELYRELSKINSMLGFFAKIICISFLLTPTYIQLMADVSADTPLGKKMPTKPFRKGIDLNGYFKLMRSNWFDCEWPALKNGVKTAFTPSLWRGTIFGKNQKVENLIKDKGFKGISAVATRTVSGSLKTILSVWIPIFRLVSGSLMLIPLAQLGLGAFNKNSKLYSPDDQKKAKEHPTAQNIFELGNNINSAGLWLAGVVPLLAMSPSNILNSGFPSTFSRTFSGFLYIGSGLTDKLNMPPVLGRSLFYIGGAFMYLAGGLQNLHRMKETLTKEIPRKT
jgi:hypothetical protein